VTGPPLRVVLFGGGPRIEHAARRLLVRLEDHPEIELVGAFCQTGGTSSGAIVRDLVRRRKLLAGPLLGALLLTTATRNVRHPVREARLRRRLRSIRARIHYVRDIHATETLAAVRAARPDLGLVYGSPILKPELFEIPSAGTLGVHHGTLPRYRGKKTTFWEMYHDEPTAGVTIQLINRGLDTGQIVKEGSVRVGARSRTEVWRRLEDLGLDLYLEAILAMKAGTARPRPQEGERGPLFRDPPVSLVIALAIRQLRRKLTGGPRRPEEDAA
jgi:folate-dependent phosphoribosylglycinamide formyltransferase PurN